MPNEDPQRLRILDGVNSIIDKELGLGGPGGKCNGKEPHYKHDKDCLVISKNSVSNLDGHKLLNLLYNQIKSNWEKRNRNKPPSPDNWLLRKRWGISKENDSPEVKLERAIASIPLPIWEDAVNWHNQVSMGSGLMNSRGSGAIDLVHDCGNKWYEFIELKVLSTTGTPLSAAMQIVLYGLLYIFSREKRHVLGYKVQDNDLLGAKGIHLRVLAPNEYYKKYQDDERGLAAFEEKINIGLNAFLAEQKSELQGLQMDFRFEKLPVLDILIDRSAVYPKTK
jgi:hypothetical protein